MTKYSDLLKNKIKKETHSTGNKAVMVEDENDKTNWYVKKASEDAFYSSAILELYGSAINSYFLGDDLAPYNIVIKSSTDDKNYVASKEIKDSISYNWNLVEKSANFTFVVALSLFNGLSNRSEYGNMVVVNLDGKTHVSVIDFQNHDYLGMHIFKDGVGIEKCYRFTELNENHYHFGNKVFSKEELQESLVKLAKVPSAVFKDIIVNKFSQFSWYLEEYNSTPTQEIDKYLSFIETAKSCIRDLYPDQFDLCPYWSNLVEQSV